MDPPVSARSHSPSTMLTSPDAAAPTPKQSKRRVPRSPRRSLSPTKMSSLDKARASPIRMSSPDVAASDIKGRSSPLTTTPRSSTTTVERRDSPAPSLTVPDLRSSNKKTEGNNNAELSTSKPSRPSTPAVARSTPSRSASKELTPPPTASSSNTPATGNNNSNSQSYLNRKAHKFSSLKKKKQASAAAGAASSGPSSPGYFMSKLFCHSLPDDRNDQNTTTATETSASDASKDNGAADEPEQGCLSIAFTQAAESLRLDSERTVRRNIQKGLSQAMEASTDLHVCEEVSSSCTEMQTDAKMSCQERTSGTCGPVKNGSPKALLNEQEIHQHREMDSLTNNMTMDSQEEDGDDDNDDYADDEYDDEAEPAALPITKVASLSKQEQQSSPTKMLPSPTKSATSSPRRMSSPKVAISTQELQATSFIASLTLQKSEEEMGREEEEDEWETTVQEARDDTVAKDTVVVVAPKTPSPKNLPSSPDRPDDEEQEDAITIARQSSSQSQSFRQSMSDRSSPSNDFDDDDFLPSDFKATNSSNPMMTILSNVMSAVSPKASPASTNNQPGSPAVTFTLTEVQDKVAAAVEAAHEQWEAATLEDLEFQHNVKLAMAVNEHREEAERTLQLHTDQLKEEHDAEMTALSETFQAKFHDLKNQAVSSKQLARQREEEMYEMEAELNTLRETSTTHSELQSKYAELEKQIFEKSLAHNATSEELTKERKTILELKAKGRQDLLALEKEKDQQVTAFQREITALEDMIRKLNADLVESKHAVEFELNEHIEIVKNDLQSAQHHLKDTQFELDKCREVVADRDMIIAKLEDELSVNMIELTACRRTLSDKKEQIEALREQLNDTMSTAPDFAHYPQLDQLQESLNEKHAQVDILACKLADKENDLGEAKQQLAEKQSRIDNLQQELAIKESEVRNSPIKLRQEMAGLRRENDQLEHELRVQKKLASQDLHLSSSEDSQMSTASRASGITPPRPSIFSSPTQGTPSKRQWQRQPNMNSTLKEKDDQIAALEKDLKEIRKKLHDAEDEMLCISCGGMLSPRKKVRFFGETATDEKEDAIVPENPAITEELLNDEGSHSSVAITNLQQRIEGKIHSVRANMRKSNESDASRSDMVDIEALKSKICVLEQRLSEKDMELAAKVCEMTAPEHSTETDALIKARQELADLKNQQKDMIAAKEHEINELRLRLMFVQESLAEKEKEMSALLARTQLLRMSDSFSHASSPAGQTHSAKSRTPASNINDNLRDSIELHEKEKEAYRQQIAVLEEQIETLTMGHEKSFAELRRASEQELVELKREMEMRIEKHMRTERELKDTLSSVDSADKEDLIDKIEQLESAKKADRTGGLREVQKKEELLQRILLLEKKERELANEHEFNLQRVRESSEQEIRRLRKEIERTRTDSQEREWQLQQAISATASFEKEELLQTIDKLEAKLESERNCSVLVKMKVTSLEKEARSIAEAHRDELLEHTNRFHAEVDYLRKQLAELHGIEDAMQITTNDRDTLEQELRQTKEALEHCQTDYHDRFKQMQALHEKEVADLRMEMNADIEKTENSAMESVEELESKIIELKSKLAAADAETKQMKEELDSTKISANEQLQKQENELIGLRNKVTLDAQAHQAQIRALERQLANNSEVLADQLKTKTKEYGTKIDALQKRLDNKDAALVALGDQLAEAKSRCKSLEDSVLLTKKELEGSNDSAKKALNELATVASELADLKAAHEQYIAECIIATEVACDEARQETIQHAEIQFKQANQLYIKLKKQYDLSKKKVENLEKDLQVTKGRLETAEATEVKWKKEVAELKQSKSKIESDAAIKAKEYRREMERLLTAAEGFEKKTKEAEATNRTNLKKLIHANSEKDKLQKEYIEIKNVCEELMSMVEAQQSGSP
ncbi:hypothetical protein MPSEU_000029300 [Mayamaea pseudoterrestris]|nr:hypothetical protein MPSEU_000029300 [Mayamaea pseudoterrestris]